MKEAKDGGKEGLILERRRNSGMHVETDWERSDFWERRAVESKIALDS